MINVASIRAAAAATPGGVVGLDKDQLDQLLAELEAGQRAQRELKMLGAIAGPFAQRGYHGGIGEAEPTPRPQIS